MDKSSMFYIKWVDSIGQGCEAWMTIDEMELEPCICHTVGYVIYETVHAITVTATIATVAGTDQFDGYITIPRVAIKKMVRLDVADTEISVTASTEIPDDSFGNGH